MRIETVQRPLRELVRSFTTGTILLPQFQRDYVWKPKKIRNLLDSLLHEYPIGGFYLSGDRHLSAARSCLRSALAPCL